MEKNMLKLVQNAMQLLQKIDLKESTLKSYENRAFRPIIVYYPYVSE